MPDALGMLDFLGADRFENQFALANRDCGGKNQPPEGDDAAHSSHFFVFDAFHNARATARAPPYAAHNPFAIYFNPSIYCRLYNFVVMGAMSEISHNLCG